MKNKSKKIKILKKLMAIIKKFRIKSFKKKTIIKLKKLSLSFGKRQILDDMSFSINKEKYLVCLGQMVLVNQLYLI